MRLDSSGDVGVVDVVRKRAYEVPPGLRETEWGTVTAVHDKGFDERLDTSESTGTVMQSRPGDVQDRLPPSCGTASSGAPPRRLA